MMMMAVTHKLNNCRSVLNGSCSSLCNSRQATEILGCFQGCWRGASVRQVCNRLAEQARQWHHNAPSEGLL